MNTTDFLTSAIVRALGCDLFPVSRQTGAGEVMSGRPLEDECHAFHFAQLAEGSDLEGFTTVVVGPERDACVYFNGQLAYRVNNPSKRFFDDLARRRMRQAEERQVYESYLN